jgi:hypothetical protein
VREFLDLYPDPAEQANEVFSAAQALTGSENVSRRPRTRLQFLFDSAIGALPRFGLPSAPRVPATHDRSAPAASTRDAWHIDAEASAEEPAFAFDAGEDDGSITATPVPDVPLAEAPADLSDDDEEGDELPESPYGAGAFDQSTHVPDTHVAADSREEDVAADVPDEHATFRVDLVGMAHLCTRVARARALADIEPLMADAARLLHAVGIIVWMWDSGSGVLWPCVGHGYLPELVAQLPNVRPDTDTAIAAAFRAAETRVVDSGEAATGAVVVPLITPGGCAGVLALELQRGGERHESVHALATILAAQLSAFAEAAPTAQASTG